MTATRRAWLVIAVPFTLIGAAIVLIAQREDWLAVGDQVASISSAVLAAVGIALTVVALRQGARVAGDDLEILAAAMRRQWGKEAQRRGLLGDDPVEVRWVRGRGGDSHQGDVASIAGLWSRLPHRRLVLLGAPGSGKTSAMLLLLIDLLAGRDAGSPVPVLVSLAGWRPADEDLDAYLVRRVNADHPGVPIRELLDRCRIVPMLDGLDEMPAGLQGTAFAKIETAVSDGRGYVLTCRTDEYRTAVPSPVTWTQVVELLPLDGREVARHLAAEGGARRWAAVVAEADARPSGPVARALSTPLMVHLARRVYRNPVADPAELTTVADPAAHLLAEYLPAVYDNPKRARRHLTRIARRLERTGAIDLEWWRLTEAIPEHRFITGCGLAAIVAAVLVAAELAVGAVTDWTPLLFAALVGAFFGGPLYGSLKILGPAAPRRVRFRLLPLIIPFLVGGSAGAAFGYGVPLVAGGEASVPGWLSITLATAAVIAACLTSPSVRAIARRSYVFSAVAVVLMVSVVAMAVNSPDPIKGAQRGLGTGILIGLFTSAVVALSHRADGTDMVTPAGSLRADRTALLVQATAFWLLLILTAGLKWSDGGPVGFALLDGVWIALLSVPAVLLAIIALRPAWFSFGVARFCFATFGLLPWRLMAFLDDAHRRGMLRQSGAAYQFRHVELQRHLARSSRATRPGRRDRTPSGSAPRRFPGR